VIKAGSAASILSDDTVLVELEDTISSVNGDSHRVSLQLRLDRVDAIFDLAPLSDFTDSFVGIMGAFSFFTGSTRSVRIISVSHDTLLFLEPPGVAHPATATAPKAVGLTKQILVTLIVGQCAIDEMLLRKTHWSCVILTGNVAFESRIGSESPARTAATLLLDRIHISVFDVVNGNCIGDEATTAAATTVAAADSTTANAITVSTATI